MGWGGVGHAGVGWVMQGWGRVGHVGWGGVGHVGVGCKFKITSNKFKTIPITKHEDYQLVYHSNQHGQIWLDANNRPIPLTQTLTGHINSTDPVLLWNSRVTREGYHSVPPAISKGSAINSTAITQQPPQHSTPTSPIQNSLTIK